MRILVVLRCGDQSLHPNWVNEHSNFDVVLSYFGDNLKYDLSHIKHVHYFKGSKWEGLYDFFKNHKQMWESYDYIWLPDDDLDTSSSNLNNFFSLVNQYKFDLSQPALTKNSYYSFPFLLQVSNFTYRKTNYVEVMAPCFSQEAFQKCWGTFSENKSGWGMDVLWESLLNKANIGIIDQTPIHHTRPVGSAGNGTGDINSSPSKDLEQLLQKYHLQIKNGCFSGLLQNNQILTSKSELFTHICIGSAPFRLANKYNFNCLYHEVFNPHLPVKSRRARWKKILGVK